MSLLRPSRPLKKYGCVGAEFVNDLTAGAAGRTGHALIVGYNDGTNIDPGPKLRNSGKNCRALGAVCHPVRSILYVAAREYFSVREQDGGTYPKF